MTYLYRVGITLSILLNVIAGGKLHQTFSARNYEWKRQGKFNLVWFIDRVFILIGFVFAWLCLMLKIETKPFIVIEHCQYCWVNWQLTNPKLKEEIHGQEETPQAVYLEEFWS